MLLLTTPLLLSFSLAPALALPGDAPGELGPNDFRVSDMGPDFDASYWALAPSVAYSAARGEYLVVWEGRDDLGSSEFQVFAQRIDAATGARVGSNDFQVSFMSTDAKAPDVAYNAADDEYLVVWRGKHGDGAGVFGAVFGQRIDGATGALSGSAILVGDRPGDSAPARVAYNSTDNEYLVVWPAEVAPNTDEGEIFAQRLDAATGTEVGADDFRISDMGPDGVSFYDPKDPDVAYCAPSNRYLVVWWGRNDQPSLSFGENEVYGQLLDGATGAEVGRNDFRISSMGPDGTDNHHAWYPAVAYSDAAREFLVVWSGNDEISTWKVFGQRVDEFSQEVGADDFAVGVLDDLFVDRPAIAYNAAAREHAVLWAKYAGGGAPSNQEIFAQQVDALTGELAGTPLRLSDMGGDDGSISFAAAPAVAYDSTRKEFLAIWHGEDDTLLLAPGELEAYGQRFVTAIAPTTTLYGCGVNPAGSIGVASGAPSIGGTLVLTLSNPLGTQGPASQAFLALAAAPDPAFPCGTLVPEWGMGGPLAAGELLLDLASPSLAVVPGGPWVPGAGSDVSLAIPNDPSALGVAVYAQGLVVDPQATGATGVPLGLTEALVLHLGH